MSAPPGKKLSPAPAQYSRENENQTRQTIEAELNRSVKRDEELQPVRLVMQDTVTGTRYLVTVASGAWTLTAL